MADAGGVPVKDMGQEGKDWQWIEHAGKKHAVSINLPLDVFASSLGVRPEVITALEVAGFLLPPEKKDEKGEAAYDDDDLRIVDAWLNNICDDATDLQREARLGAMRNN